MTPEGVEDIAATLVAGVKRFDPFDYAKAQGYRIVWAKPPRDFAGSVKLSRCIYIDPAMPINRVWMHLCHELFELEMEGCFGLGHEDVANHGARAMLMPRERFLEQLRRHKLALGRVGRAFQGVPLDQVILRVADLIEGVTSTSWGQIGEMVPVCEARVIHPGDTAMPSEMEWTEQIALRRVWTLKPDVAKYSRARVSSKAWRVQDWGPRQAAVLSYRHGALGRSWQPWCTSPEVAPAS
jgi:hypothetical protein